MKLEPPSDEPDREEQADAVVQPELHVRFGAVDVASAVRRMTTSTSIRDLPGAEFVIDPSALPNAPVDYFAEVRISATWQGVEQPMFTGAVVSATPAEGGVAIECRGGLALTEQPMPGMAFWEMQGCDVIHLTARSAGLPEERLRIDGLDALPVEGFRVVAPTIGVSLPEPVHVGTVQFVDRSKAAEFLAEMDPPSELRERFFASDVHAVAYVTAAKAFDAEVTGLEEIETAFSWLTARSRYGLVHLPGGQTLSFQRETARARPVRGEVIAVRGLQTSRRWMRAPGATSRTVPLALGDELQLAPPLPVSLTLQDRQALFACRRAVSETDPLGAITALWDAIEFYTAGTTVPPLFTKTELRSLRESFRVQLTDRQQKRLVDTLGQLNSPPLMARLIAALETDGVPVSDGEIQLLQRLRGLRNDAVHGRNVQLPEANELEHAVGVVSRMLVYRLHRRGEA